MRFWAKFLVLNSLNTKSAIVAEYTGLTRVPIEN